MFRSQSFESKYSTVLKLESLNTHTPHHYLAIHLSLVIVQNMNFHFSDLCRGKMEKTFFQTRALICGVHKRFVLGRWRLMYAEFCVVSAQMPALSGWPWPQLTVWTFNRNMWPQHTLWPWDKNELISVVSLTSQTENEPSELSTFKSKVNYWHFQREKQPPRHVLLKTIPLASLWQTHIKLV